MRSTPLAVPSLILRAVLLAVIAAVLVPLGGCERPEDGVLETYHASEHALANRDAQAYLTWMTPESIELTKEHIRLARFATKEEAQALPPMRLISVLHLRSKLGKNELREMTPFSYFEWMMDEGVYYADEDDGIKPITTWVEGDKGFCNVGDPANGDVYYTAYFQLKDGYWYLDHVAGDAASDKEFIDDARAMGKTVLQHILDEYKEYYGAIPSNVWTPPDVENR